MAPDFPPRDGSIAPCAPAYETPDHFSTLPGFKSMKRAKGFAARLAFQPLGFRRLSSETARGLAAQVPTKAAERPARHRDPPPGRYHKSPIKLRSRANRRRAGTAVKCGSWAATLAVGALAAGCAGDPGPPAQARVVTASSPSQAEDYCAWYGDARDGVLYFGQAAFWSAMRAHDGDPLGDLATPGPQRIGRFDLRRERMLPALDVTAAGARSGVWREGRGRISGSARPLV